MGLTHFKGPESLLTINRTIQKYPPDHMFTLTTLPLIFANFRGWEWLIILLVVLLLFGGKKIPELMRGVGRGIHSFRQGMEEAKDEMRRPIHDYENPADKDRR